MAAAHDPTQEMPLFTPKQQEKFREIVNKIKGARGDYSDALPNVKLLRDRGVFGSDYKIAKIPLNAARQAFDSARAELGKLLLSIFAQERAEKEGATKKDAEAKKIAAKEDAVKVDTILKGMVPPLKE
jgi:hypothetical protein